MPAELRSSVPEASKSKIQIRDLTAQAEESIFSHLPDGMFLNRESNESTFRLSLLSPTYATYPTLREFQGSVGMVRAVDLIAGFGRKNSGAAFTRCTTAWINGSILFEMNSVSPAWVTKSRLNSPSILLDLKCRRIEM